MRLIAILQDGRQGKLLSEYLTSLSIDNILDVSTGDNWGEENYGVTTYTVWVVDEENLPRALEIARDFANNSNADHFQKQTGATFPSAAASPSPAENFEPSQPEESDAKAQNILRAKPPGAVEPLGKVTLYLLMLCSILFLFTEISAPTVTRQETMAFSKQQLPSIPIYYSTLKKELLFDYPRAFEIVDEIVANANAEYEKLESVNELPKDLFPLITQFQQTPYWKGFYEKIISFFQRRQVDWHIDEPLFEKLHQGEGWRLLSPIFLHADIFHLLFNMIWLAVLGRQLEQRMGWWRYLLFIGVTGAASNIAQYLMTGPNFLGFSGVICAMITFVWVRQKKTPWEGYLLQPTTLNFALLFLFFILALQLISFYTEIVYQQPIAPQIANTAHMTGLFLGIILGNVNFFAWKPH